MSTYLYELPTTGSVTFSSFCVDHTAAYTSAISDATQARANLRAALKESKRTDGEKDYLRLVKVVDDYLPYLFGIKACIDAGEINLSSEPVFSWRSTLSSNLFNQSPRQDVYSIYADLAFTILTHAFVLSNLARSTVSSLGDYEFERSISESQRKSKDDKLNFAVTLLCKASGAFRFINEYVLGEWDKNANTNGNFSYRPIDITPEIVSALSKMALADAQILAIRKLLSKSAYDSNIAPGPPLPRSHPSPALVAKLYLECAELYGSARALAKTPSKARSAKSPLGEGEEVCNELRRYLADQTDLCTALAHKWLGVDNGENGSSEKGGLAVAYLALAKTELEDLKDSGLGVHLGKSKDTRDKLREKVVKELETVKAFWKNYKRLNDTLHFQPLPTVTELKSLIPGGVAAVALRPFAAPTPSFGPGSLAYVRKQTERLELKPAPSIRTLELSNPDPVVEAPSLEGSSSYAGAGSYF